MKYTGQGITQNASLMKLHSFSNKPTTKKASPHDTLFTPSGVSESTARTLTHESLYDTRVTAFLASLMSN